jgi:pyruvate dehydrogenase E2 component (dihydrolipoamide acetyltransferase)
VRVEFRLPDIGEGLAEGEVVEWLVTVGDHVAEDAPVLLMQTDKAVVEMTSPASGIVVEQRAASGGTVRVGEVLFVIENDAQAAPAAEVHGRASPAAAEQETALDNRSAAGETAAPAAATAASGSAQASPAVRKRARDLGVDIGAVAGTGSGGRITAEDVEAASLGTPAAPSTQPDDVTRRALASSTGEKRVPLRGIQRQMAQTLVSSVRGIPHVTGFHEMDAASLMDLFRRLEARSRKRGERFRFDSLLVRIAAVALAEHPLFNASFDDETSEIVYKPGINVGLAVSTPQGLLVPVVHDAGSGDIDQISRTVERLIELARSGRIGLPDLRGATFTVTNSGPWHGWFGTSLIREPEMAIMGVGRVQDRPVVRAGTITVRPILPVAITFDHRFIDGEQGMRFAATVRELVESPELLLMRDWR